MEQKVPFSIFVPLLCDTDRTLSLNAHWKFKQESSEWNEPVMQFFKLREIVNATGKKKQNTHNMHSQHLNDV